MTDLKCASCGGRFYHRADCLAERTEPAGSSLETPRPAPETTPCEDCGHVKAVHDLVIGCMGGFGNGFECPCNTFRPVAAYPVLPEIPPTKPLHFLSTSDGDRVWCVRCDGWKCTEGEDDPCPPETPEGACPIQEGDESKWKPVASDDIQKAIDALDRERKDIDDAGVIAANMADDRATGAERVAVAAQRFCAELQEDAEGVPQSELKALHAALDQWEIKEQE